MDLLRDRLALLAAFYKASWTITLKSPLNVWIANLLRLVYYGAMFLFWFGVRSTEAGAEFMSQSEVYGFLITVGVVENAFLCFVGRGSLDLMHKISTLTLEPVLLWPRNAIACFALLRPNLIYLPIFVLFVIIQAVYYAMVRPDPQVIVIHLVAVTCGIFVLSGISFVYRLTAFWTDSIVRVRHSNPSFKILIRPASAFQGALRLVLMTIFPALFITGVPYELLVQEQPGTVVLLSILAALTVWGYVLLIWRIGVRRYARLAV
jgi:ABC-2 type transport system permease protein